MSASVIDKYLAKKKKDLVEYAKILETVITLEKNTLWTTKQEFTTIVKGIIEYYADHYYFDNNVHRENPVEYANDNLNAVLKSLIAYYQKTGQSGLMQTKKNETFLLSALICAACYADIATNVVDGNFTETRGKFKYLLQYLQKTNILKIYINSKAINTLFDRIKQSVSKEEKFFGSFQMENCYNEYHLVAKEPVYYLTSYFYQVEGLETFDKKMVKSINSEFKDKYLSISYDLLAIELLKELLSNNEVKRYFIKATDSAIRKPSVFAPLNDEILKEYFAILIDFEDSKAFKEEISTLEALGYHFVYDFKESGEISQNTFLRNMDILVHEELLKKNEEKLSTWKNQGINFILKSNEEEK